MFKKVFFTFLLLAVLALGAASYYVSTIDWNLHKDKIAYQFEQITGKRIVFKGPVSLEFLPTPTLTVNDIQIYNRTPNQEQTGTPLASIEKLVSDLSLLSLFQGSFKVNRMVLLKPQILAEFTKDGHFNWTPEKTVGEDDFQPAFDIAFNSIMLEDATIHILNPVLETDITLEKVNAEISAQSIYGPYRIDGNFIKDDNPAGFALNIGNISESFATSVNLVLTHPTSDSYARFDGAVQTNANEIKGNFTMESKNPSLFINDLADQVILPEEYNYPIESSVELSVNNRQVNLSSFVIKYGEKTSGAGNILIPLEKPAAPNEKRKIELRFDMTNLDLEPMVGIVLEQIKQYDNGKLFHPYFDFNLIADIQAVKAYYKGENIRNLTLSADLVNDVLSIKKLNALLPGDTETSVTGDIFENDEALSYKLQVQASSQDLLAFLTWLELQPEVYTQSVYRHATLDFDIAGNLDQISLKPYRVTVDKSGMQGILGIVRKPQPRYFITVQSSNINFDNYLPPLTAEEKNLSGLKKITALLKKLSFLQDADVHLEAKVDSGIYNQTPFEKLDVALNAKDGQVQFTKFAADELLSAAVNMEGTLSNLGTDPQISEVKFQIDSTDVNDLYNVFATDLPNWPLFAEAEELHAQGSLSGSLHDLTLQADADLDQLHTHYEGSLSLNNRFDFNGLLELKTPDFTKFIQSVGYNFQPQNSLQRILTVNGNVSGHSKNWHLDNMETFIGSNKYNGSFALSTEGEKPSVTADIQASDVALDRIFYDASQASGVVLKRGTKNEYTFLEKPLFSATLFNFEPFKTFDLDASVTAENLHFGAAYFKNAQAKVNVRNNQIVLNSFFATYHEAPVNMHLEINLDGTPNVSGTASLQNYNLQNLGGSIYRVAGTFSADASFNGPCSSEEVLMASLSGFASFSLDDATIKGLNLAAIEQDLAKREYSENLFEMLRENLSSGETAFPQIKGRITFDNGKYQLEDLTADASVAQIKASGTGSVSAWDTETSAELSLKNLAEKIVPINFKWTGSLATPSVVVEAQALKEKYDSHWANIERRKQEAETARLNALNDKMNAAQEKLKTLKINLTVDVLPLIDKYKPLSATNDIRNQYNVLQMQLVDMNNRLDMMAKKPEGEFDDKDIIQINASVTNFTPQLRNIRKEIDRIYSLDLKTHTAKDYKTIQGLVSNTETKSVNYKSTMNAYGIRLKQLESAVDLNVDPLTQDFVNKSETAIAAIRKLNEEALRAKDVASKSSDIPELEKQKENMASLLEQIQTQHAALTDSLEHLLAYLQKLVYVEEYGEVEPTEGEKPKAKDRIQILEADDKKSEEKSTGESTEKSAEQAPRLLLAPEETPQSFSEPEEKTQPLSEPEETPRPLFEQPEETPQPLTSEEPPAPKVKETLENAIISYPSKVATTGSLKTNSETPIVQEQTPPAPTQQEPRKQQRLLRPTSRKTLVTGGTITKK